MKGEKGKIFFILLFFIIFIYIFIPIFSEKAEAGEDEYLEAYRKAVHYFNPRLKQEEADKIASAIIRYSKVEKLDPRFVVAVVASESSFRIRALSSQGAQGLGQLMPGTAEIVGVANPYDPVENIRGTTRYLRINLDRWSHLPPQQMVENALASYNAGYGVVIRYNGIPPYGETKWYVFNVISLWRKLCGLK